VKTHYQLLDVGADASADEIKKAFRREIARYHPDKVQHLGPEFQEIAAGRAAELTEAYRVLMDEALRAEYDERLNRGVTPPAEPRPASQAPAERTSQDRPADATAGASAPRPPADRVPSDFVRKAGASRLRDAVAAVSGAAPASISGFDAAYDIKGKGGLFKKSAQPVRLLVKFVAQVDPEAIAAAWVAAVRSNSHDHVRVLLLLGAAGMAPAKELSAAIAEQRRKTRGVAPVVVPVDVRDWEALFPPETPDTVRAIMQRLREGAA
jgi:curved DNA-binding protein CbpA